MGKINQSEGVFKRTIRGAHKICKGVCKAHKAPNGHKGVHKACNGRVQGM